MFISWTEVLKCVLNFFFKSHISFLLSMATTVHVVVLFLIKLIIIKNSSRFQKIYNVLGLSLTIIYYLSHFTSLIMKY